MGAKPAGPVSSLSHPVGAALPSAPLPRPAPIGCTGAVDVFGDGEGEGEDLVLAGDWSDIQVGLSIENPEGYEASWRLPEGGRVGEIGRYRGYPILSPRGLKDRCVYVADLASWGDFVRAQTDGNHDLRVEIKPITIDRARELLAANPEHFPSEPDEESKLRKLQTRVEIVIGARTGFRVADPARARRISPIGQVEESDEVAQG